MGELYGEWVLEIMCHFSKSVITSDISFCASAEIGYHGKFVIFKLGSAGAAWSVHTVASQFLLGLGLVLEPKDPMLPSGKRQFCLVKTSKPKIFSLCCKVSRQHALLAQEP